MRIRLGGRTFTVLCGTEGSRWATRNEGEFLTVEGIYKNIHRYLGSEPEVSLICQDGDRHAVLRRWQKRGMSRKYSEQRLDVSLRVADEELDHAGADGTFDMTDFCKGLVYRQLGMTMAGVAPPKLLGDYRLIIDAVINSVRFPWTQRLPMSRRIRGAVRRVKEFSQQLALQRSGESSDEGMPLFIDDILDGVDRGICDERHLPSLVLGPFLAGLDTLGALDRVQRMGPAVQPRRQRARAARGGPIVCQRRAYRRGLP